VHRSVLDDPIWYFAFGPNLGFRIALTYGLTVRRCMRRHFAAQPADPSMLNDAMSAQLSRRVPRGGPRAMIPCASIQMPARSAATRSYIPPALAMTPAMRPLFHSWNRATPNMSSVAPKTTRVVKTAVDTYRLVSGAIAMPSSVKDALGFGNLSRPRAGPV
jgi:hypothetical protein